MWSDDNQSNTVNIQGKNNTIYGENTAGGNAFGIFIAKNSTGDINIFSTSNTIYGEVSGDGGDSSLHELASGIFSGSDSTANINITGNNNTIYGSNSTYNNYKLATGIFFYGSNGTLNILSKNNTIYGEIEESDNNYFSQADGITLNSSNPDTSTFTLNINGDKNNIYGKNFDGYRADGIYASGSQSNINIGGDGNVISASSQTTATAQSPLGIAIGIYTEGNLLITGSNNAVNASANTGNNVIGIDYAGSGILSIANTTVNVSNDSQNGTAIALFITNQPTSVVLYNNTFDVNNAATNKDAIGILINSSDVSNFTIEDNVFNVTSEGTSFGIYSNYPLGSKKSQWISDNTFEGDITDDNRVVD
jgi:hypothetical protein